MTVLPFPTQPRQQVVATSVADFIAIQRCRDWLPAHRVHWFNGLSDADQAQIARDFKTTFEPIAALR